MNYKDNGFKPRDDWIMGNDVIRIDANSKIPSGTDSTAPP